MSTTPNKKSIEREFCQIQTRATHRAEILPSDAVPHLTTYATHLAESASAINQDSHSN